MDYKKAYEMKMQKVRAEVDVLMTENSEPTLTARFLKDFGCINFKSDEFYHELDLAREYHKRHMELRPMMHELQKSELYRCYYQTTCKCGFAEADDSSD